MFRAKNEWVFGVIGTALAVLIMLGVLAWMPAIGKADEVARDQKVLNAIFKLQAAYLEADSRNPKLLAVARGDIEESAASRLPAGSHARKAEFLEALLKLPTLNKATVTGAYRKALAGKKEDALEAYKDLAKELRIPQSELQ